MVFFYHSEPSLIDLFSLKIVLHLANLTGYVVTNIVTRDIKSNNKATISDLPNWDAFKPFSAALLLRITLFIMLKNVGAA